MHPGALFTSCPACGADALNVEEKEKFNCSACSFEFYYNPAPATAGIITNEKGEVLLVRRAKEPFTGKLDLPGGFVDPGEGAVEALERELQEELGLAISNIEFFASGPDVYTYSGVTYAILDLVFTASVSGSVQSIQEEEISEWFFAAPESINPDDLAFEFLQKAMRMYTGALNS